MNWLDKFAQDYGNGSAGTDFLSVQDGSETDENERDITSPSNGNGQGNVPSYTDKNHPFTADGENTNDSLYSTDGRNRDRSKTDQTMEQPYGEALVDDNHGNVNAGHNLLDLMKIGNKYDDEAAYRGMPLTDLLTKKITPKLEPLKKLTPKTARQGEEQDFFTSHITGGPADSPQILNDGHADEELIRDQNGVKSTNNNFDTSTKTDESYLMDPDVVDKDTLNAKNKGLITPDINKGRIYAHLNWVPNLMTSIIVKKADIPKVPVQDEKLPVEPSHIFDTLVPAPVKGKATPPAHARFDDTAIKADSTIFSRNDLHNTDYQLSRGNVDQTMYPDEEENLKINKKEDFGSKDYGDQNYMSNAPLQNDHDEETNNYSGFNNTASLLDIFINADYNQLMPSSNPNSGQDTIDSLPHRAPTDGKQSNVSGYSENKDQDDPTAYRQKRQKWDRVEDTEHYFNTLGTGGGIGNEGDGVNYSGVDNS